MSMSRAQSALEMATLQKSAAKKKYAMKPLKMVDVCILSAVAIGFLIDVLMKRRNAA